MNTTELERMIVRLLGDGTSYERMIQTAQASTARAAGVIQFHSQKIESFAGSLRLYASSARGTLTQLAALTGVAGIGGTIFESIRRFASMEQTKVAFTSLVGDTKRAEAALKDLTKFAADTPFELPEILNAAKQMIGFGTQAEDIVPTMRMLGDVAAGLGIDLSGLTYVFGTLKSQGRAFTVDINQFATRGIPIWEQLAVNMGKTVPEIREMVEKGKIGFKEVEAAFKATTGPMAKFTGGMEKQAQTLSGLFSTLKDNVGASLTKIGEIIVDKFHLKDLIKNLTAGAESIADWFAGPMFTSGVQLAEDAVKTLRDTIVNTYQTGVRWVTEFYETNRQTVNTVLAVAAGLGAVYAAIRLLGVGIGVIGFILQVLKVQQIAGIALWVAWAGALLTVKTVFALFNFQVAALNAGVALLSALWGIYTAATAGATAGTWLLNIAIAVLESELIVPLIIAVVALAGTFAIVGAAALALGVTLYSVYQTAVGLIDAFMNMSMSGAGMDRITSIFGEWYQALLVIIDLAQRDLPAAWEYTKLTFNLMVAQINQRWPAVWEFVKSGWAAVAEFIGAKFKSELAKATGEVVMEMGAALGHLNPMLGKAFQGIGANLIKMGRNSGVGLEDTLVTQIEAAKKKFDEAMAVGDDEGVKAAQKQMKQFRMKQAVKEWEDWGKQGEGILVPAAAKTGAEMGAAVSKNAIKEVQKFDAALFRSAEGAARIAEYHARLDNTIAGKGGITATTRNPVTGAIVARQQNPGVDAGGFAKNGPDMKEKYLSQIAEGTKIIANKVAAGVVLAPANLG